MRVPDPKTVLEGSLRVGDRVAGGWIVVSVKGSEITYAQPFQVAK